MTTPSAIASNPMLITGVPKPRPNAVAHSDLASALPPLNAVAVAMLVYHFSEKRTYRSPCAAPRESIGPVSTGQGMAQRRAGLGH